MWLFVHERGKVTGARHHRIVASSHVFGQSVTSWMAPTKLGNARKPVDKVDKVDRVDKPSNHKARSLSTMPKTEVDKVDRARWTTLKPRWTHALLSTLSTSDGGQASDRAVTGSVHPVHHVHLKNGGTEKNSPRNAHDTTAMDGEPCASAPPNEHETKVNRPIPPPPLSAPLAEHQRWLDAIGADDLERDEWLAQLGRETAACTAGGCQ